LGQAVLAPHVEPRVETNSVDPDVSGVPYHHRITHIAPKEENELIHNRKKKEKRKEK
jgi:hypothetical protein